MCATRAVHASSAFRKVLKILNIVGARPNFMKMAPILREMARRSELFSPQLVHTGQHYDESMSGSFFEDLSIRPPDFNLEVGSASHAVQTAKIMLEFEKVVTQERPDWVLVVGDVNSTLACTLVAVKLGIKTAHVEAGLRSFDRSMPEEINRILTDSIADLLLTTSDDADENLLREGISPSKIKFVGNVMIDSLLFNLERARELGIAGSMGLQRDDFAVATLHRPSNVDDPTTLEGIITALRSISEKLPVIFPVHPRTKASMDRIGLTSEIPDSIRLVEPLGYLEFLSLYSEARLVLTDSGGLQEETTALGIPCLTLRENTERPITVELGTNKVVGTRPEDILSSATPIIDGSSTKAGQVPPLWDGKSAERICDALLAE